jgi:hypothetical protein
MQRMAAGDCVTLAVVSLGIRAKRSGLFARGAALPVRKTRPSAALATRKAELDRPVIVKDPVLGRLKLRREDNSFRGQCRLGERPVRLTVERRSGADEAGRDTADLARARKLVQALPGKLPAIRAAIAREHLRRYNDLWRGDRKILSSAAFVRQFRPESVDVASDGQMTVWFSDSDLFHGHGLLVTVGARGAITDVVLAG